MSSIYVVTHGNYSDYHIVTVFDNEPDAKRFAETCVHKSEYDDGPWVEKHEVNQYQGVLASGLRPYIVKMQRNGDVIKVHGADLEHDEQDIIIGDTATYETSHPWPPIAYIKVMARDETHAVKIANERRIRWLVEDKWPADPQPSEHGWFHLNPDAVVAP